jgi:hypothetical protein
MKKKPELFDDETFEKCSSSRKAKILNTGIH